MKRTLLLLCLCLLPISARAGDIFVATDPLAARDEFGLLHQSRDIFPTDLAPRYPCRLGYYFSSPQALVSDPAYVGALQRDLRRLGYYCGPIDGVLTPEVRAAIAHLQKNSSQRVTGTLTFAVRRSLYLP